ncbi:hypothetical protein ACWGB8_27480 [Kitasatospora sp. NPDC054939]
MRAHLRAAGAVLACAGAAAALSGCASQGGTAAVSPALTPPPLGAAVAPPSGREGMLQLPLSAFGSDDGAAAERTAAMRVVITRCMHAAGFAAFTRADAVDEGTRPADVNAMPAGAFGYLPESVAAVQGFHPGRPPAAPGPPRRAITAAEEPALQECVKNSYGELAPAGGGGSELVSRLFGQAQAAVERDARVLEAVRAWTDCMARSGFPGVTPSGLVEQYRARAAATPEPTAEELAAARADASCTTGSNLAGVWFAALTGYQQQLIAANQEKLAEYRDGWKAYRAKLAKIVAEG